MKNTEVEFHLFIRTRSKVQTTVGEVAEGTGIEAERLDAILNKRGYPTEDEWELIMDWADEAAEDGHAPKVETWDNGSSIKWDVLP